MNRVDIFNQIKNHCEVLNGLTGENTVTISLTSSNYTSFKITFYHGTSIWCWDYKIIDERIISPMGRPHEYKSDFLFFISALIPYSISKGIHDSAIRLEKLKLLDL